MKKLFFPIFLILIFVQPNFLVDGSSTYTALPRGAKVRLGDFRGGLSERIIFALSPDGTRIAVANLLDEHRQVIDSLLEIRLYDVATEVELARLSGHTAPVADMAFSADSTVLASGSADKTVRLWDARTGEHLTTLAGHTDSVNTIAFSAEGATLASGSTDKTVRLWDATNVRAVQPKAILRGHTEAVHSVGFAAKSAILVSVNTKRFGLWDAHTGKQIAMSEEYPNGISAVAFSPNSDTLASIGTWGDWAIRLWDAHTGQSKSVLLENTGNVYCIALAPDGTTLAAGREDATIQLWDTATGKIRATLKGMRASATSLAFSEDGELLAGRGWELIKVWDTRLCQHKATFFERDISSLAFLPDNATLVSASRSGTVVLWKPVSVVDTDIITRITPSRTVSPAIGKQLTFNIEIVGGKNVAGYQLTVEFDATAMRYISSTNGDYLSGDTYRMPPVIDENQVTFASSAFTENRNGNGLLATVTFEGVALKTSTLNLTNVILSDRGGHRSRPTVENGQVIEP